MKKIKKPPFNRLDPFFIEGDLYTQESKKYYIFNDVVYMKEIKNNRIETWYILNQYDINKLNKSVFDRFHIYIF